MFRFENQKVFLFLWLVPLMLILAFVFYQSAEARLKKILGLKTWSLLTASLSKRKRITKQILQALVLFLMIVAMARPQMGESKQEVKAEGIELVLLLDVSESMMTEDVRPNRLEQMKTEMSRLIDLLPGHKIGIVAFAGSSTLLSPLSTDPGALKLYLESLSPLVVSTQGTDFKRGLDESFQVLERGGLGGQQDETIQVTRVILVASDGEDNEPGAIEEAEKLTEKNVRLFALAYGTQKGGAIPVRDSLGYMKGYKKDSSGKTILSSVNGDILKLLSEKGKGSFYHATFAGDHLKKIVEDLNKLEKTQFDSKLSTQYDEKFQIFLFLAFFSALIELILGERKRRRGPWRGRFEIPLVFVFAVLSSFFINHLPSVSYAETTLKSWKINNEGAALLKKKNYFGAQDKFVEALKEDPFSAFIQINLGLAFYGQGKGDKAQASYEAALKLGKDPQSLFVANFNLAESYHEKNQNEDQNQEQKLNQDEKLVEKLDQDQKEEQRHKKVKKILHYYQEALKYKPDSIEVKTNIELMLKEQEGKGQGKDKENDKDKDKNKGKEQSQGKDKDKDKNEENNKKENGKDKDGEKEEKKDQPKKYQENKPQPPQFQSKELSPKDVKQILDEIAQHERKIRAEYNKKQVKEKPRDKDW